MGCTLVGCVVTTGGAAHWTSVGDSPLWRLGGDVGAAAGGGGGEAARRRTDGSGGRGAACLVEEHLKHLRFLTRLEDATATAPNSTTMGEAPASASTVPGPPRP